jgi:hypothetical protein
MEVDSAMLAMGADHSSQGLLHIFGGGFDTLQVNRLPGALAPFWLVARALKQGVEAEEQHAFTLLGFNPAGEPFALAADQQFTLVPPSVPGGYSKASIIIQVQMAVGVPGVYQFALSIDGVERKRIPLRIEVVEAPPQPK